MQKRSGILLGLIKKTIPKKPQGESRGAHWALGVGNLLRQAGRFFITGEKKVREGEKKTLKLVGGPPKKKIDSLGGEKQTINRLKLEGKKLLTS